MESTLIWRIGLLVLVLGLAPSPVIGQEAPPTAETAGAAAPQSKAVSDAIAAIREQPPAHEREEPWTVPVPELELELQPLRVADLEERVEKWLEILELEVRGRTQIDIALSRVDDAQQRAELAERSAAQQEIVQATVLRVQAVLLVLQKRGGDITEYKKYISTATGQKLNLTDPGVVTAQAMAWVKSKDGGVKLGLNVLKFIGLLLVFYVLARILGKAVSTAVSRVPKASSLLRDFLVGGTKRITMFIGLVVAVSALGVNVTPLVAAIGAAGLVIGLALQGTLSNFASGILILFYRPFDVGDVINGGGVTGKVESMTLVSTSILTLDNQVMVVPNNEIWNGVITNITGRDTRRVDLMFGIGYGDDIGRAIEVVEDVLEQDDKVLADPKPVVRVHELGDNSVNLVARPWARTEDYWEVYWSVMRTVKERFDDAGLNIPFPQRDLHVPGTIEVKLADGSRLAPAAAAVGGNANGPARPATGEPAPAGETDES